MGALDRMVYAAEKGESEGEDIPEVMLLEEEASMEHGYERVDDRRWVVHPYNKRVLILAEQ